MNNQQQANAYRYHVDLIFITILGLMLFCSIATIFWGADRSLGVGDEGAYLLAARYPDEIHQNVSSVYKYTGYLFQVVSFSPVAFRLLGVILVCISAFIFWAGFYKFFSAFYTNAKTVKCFRLYSLLFIELGALLQYQWFYLTPNYNTLIAITINTFAGSILYGFAQMGNWQKNKKTVILAFAFGGMSIGLALFTKFPAGICFLFLCFLVIILWSGIKRYQKTILSVAVFAGISVWFLGHFFLIQPPHIWWQMFKEGWRLFQTLGLHTEHKSVIYFKDLSFFVYSAIKIYWPCYLIICIIYPFYILRGNSRKLSASTNSLIIFIVMLSAALLSVKAGIFIDERKPVDGSIPFYAVFYLAWILLLLTLWMFNTWYKSRCCDARPPTINVNIKIVLGLLVALPIAGSVGTSNPLYNVPLCHAATWFGAILLLLVLFKVGESDNFRLRLFCVLSIGAFSASQIIQGYIYDPQGISFNLLQQVEETSVGFPVKTLKLDSRTHKLVKELSSIAKANGFKPGDDIIAISYIPGLVYAMGGRSPGHPTFLLGSIGLIDKKQAENYSRLALQYADIKRLKKAFVLLNNVESADVELLLESRGLNYPNEYEKVGAVCFDSGSYCYSFWKPAMRTED